MELEGNIENLRKNNIETTFKEMGIRASKSIAEHLLKENAYQNNLLPDISTVDYTKDHAGRTNLQEIPGFGIFVDDMYIYGYLRKQDIVYNRIGGILCTTGAGGSASYILEQIRTAVNCTLGKDMPTKTHTNIMHTIPLQNKEKCIIHTTILKIERKIPIVKKWKEYNNGEEPVAAFVVKVDVSNIPIEKIQENIKDLENRLFFVLDMVYIV